MIPTSHEIAVAIVAASKETGADPVDVLLGGERVGGCPIPKAQGISRARAYAARAIDKVFNRPDVAIARPDVARLVGANKPSWGAFFSSLDARPLPWWSDDAFKRVVDAVMECDPPQDQIQKPQARSDEPAPLKMGPLRPVPGRIMPAVKSPELGTTGHRGYRPAPGAYERELDSLGHGRLRTRLDQFAEGMGKPRAQDAGGDDQSARRERERRQCNDLLADAAANTARLQAQLPPEPEE